MNASESNHEKSPETMKKNEPIVETLAKTPYPAWTMATLCTLSYDL